MPAMRFGSRAGGGGVKAKAKAKTIEGAGVTKG